MLKKIKKVKGQSSVEMAIVMIAIIGLLFFVADVAFLSFNWLGLEFSVLEGTRYGAVTPSASESDIEEHVTQVADSVGVSGVISDVDSSSEIVKVTASRTHTFFPFLQLVMSLSGASDFTMSAHAERTKELS